MTTNSAKTRGNLVPDLIAGLTTGVANIPDAMASAVLAACCAVETPLDRPSWKASTAIKKISSTDTTAAAIKRRRRRLRGDGS